MGVADNKLFADLITHIIEGKRTCFLFDPAMENDLKQNVAQLFAEKVCVFEVNSLDGFAGLLDEVAFDRLVGLFSIPRAASLASQKSYDIEQIVDRIMLFLLIFNHRKTLP